VEDGTIQRVAHEFWESAGDPGHFPRDLEAAVLWTLPLAVFKLPRLWVSDVQDWLVTHHIHFQFYASDRQLHGCLIARGGHGCVLLNGTDDEDELRFSLAHESAHFILDYLRPRQRAAQRMGPSILEVFDGLRPPTVQERTHAILSRVPIGFHTHLMERSGNGLLGYHQAEVSEGGADLLALELLAPEVEVRWRVRHSRLTGRQQTLTEIASQTLQKEFGLPPGIASGYAQYLYPPVHGSSVREWLQQRDS
jgi:hypothetical protein